MNAPFNFVHPQPPPVGFLHKGTGRTKLDRRCVGSTSRCRAPFGWPGAARRIAGSHLVPHHARPVLQSSIQLLPCRLSLRCCFRYSCRAFAIYHRLRLAGLFRSGFSIGRIQSVAKWPDCQVIDHPRRFGSHRSPAIGNIVAREMNRLGQGSND